MKIVYISTLFYPHPNVGGIEKAVKEISYEQAKMGHEVHIITSSHRLRNKRNQETYYGVTIHIVKSLQIHYPQLTIPLEFPSKIISQADIICGWDPTYYFVYKLTKISKKMNKPVAVYFLGVDSLRRHYNPIIRFIGRKYEEMVNMNIANADLALVTNDYEKNILKERYGIESTVLPHGVDAQYFEMPNMERSFRRKYRVEGRIIAYIGRIHPTKGLDLLIRAFIEVVKHESEVTLLIAGKGDVKYLDKCMNLVKKFGVENKVKYLGYLSEEDKIGLIDASEFVVIPSRHSGESYPLVIDEVKARGKPLVVTNYGTLPNRIVNYIEGIVVNADANSLAKGIEYALSNSRSFRILMKPYTWNKIAEKLLALYENITKNQRAVELNFC
jgi:glycosyltransferase involved in cell wall biosynthesis